MKKNELNIFPSISLEEMNDVSLMKRMDTKFIISLDSLSAILSDVSDDYQILQIDGNRLMSYASTYFDTKDSLFYFQHHNKIAKRTKIRIRNYVESELSFLEIKQKDSKGNTVKSRIKLDSYKKELDAECNQFISETTGESIPIGKSITNNFQRFTLVSTKLNERVTVDTNLEYEGQAFNKRLAIIELKQSKLNRTSPIFQALKKRQIHPYSISKYCIGMASHKPDIKQNFFKHKFLTINKITA